MEVNRSSLIIGSIIIFVTGVLIFAVIINIYAYIEQLQLIAIGPQLVPVITVLQMLPLALLIIYSIIIILIVRVIAKGESILI